MQAISTSFAHAGDFNDEFNHRRDSGAFFSDFKGGPGVARAAFKPIYYGIKGTSAYDSEEIIGFSAFL